MVHDVECSKGMDEVTWQAGKWSFDESGIRFFDGRKRR